MQLIQWRLPDLVNMHDLEWGGGNGCRSKMTNFWSRWVKNTLAPRLSYKPVKGKYIHQIDIPHQQGMHSITNYGKTFIIYSIVFMTWKVLARQDMFISTASVTLKMKNDVGQWDQVPAAANSHFIQKHYKGFKTRNNASCMNQIHIKTRIIFNICKKPNGLIFKRK